MVLEAVQSQQTVSGAAMDRPLPPRRRNSAVLAAGVALLSAVFAGVWSLIPQGFRIAAADIRTATVTEGMFHNDVLVRASAAPLHTVMLDALESGRVEEVFVSDGARVDKGELLFRLSNPQLRLELVAREADRAQQISNLSILRVSIETSRTEHERRMLERHFALIHAQRQEKRFAALAQSGLIAVSTLEDSQDRLKQEHQALEDEKARDAIEMRIKREGLMQMEQAVERLDAGLRVVNESIEGLAVRAPIAGRLTDFRLQLGEIVKPDQHIGRIDDPSRFKLVAEIDEYYLGSVSVAQTGAVTSQGREYAVAISRVFPQIKDGRFTIELLFTGDSPAGMQPGQSSETRIVLGEARPSLILPNDAFVNDSGGTWVFVLSPDGNTASRRAIRVGRRNNSQVQVLSGLAAGERVIVSTYAAFGKAERLQIEETS